MELVDEPNAAGRTALPLFTTGLGALGLLGWLRKRENGAAALATFVGV
jgi:hypothetical protein